MGAKMAKKCQFCMFSCFFNFWGSFRGKLFPLKLPHFEIHIGRVLPQTGVKSGALSEGTNSP